ncbi:hypothetical protein HPP92_026015 [Vanilla planifolia]|uniref:Sec1-like protein n=1 Tax=Vanilla planifolia TaxID=51239 RepID=A0A835PGE7_VANPL|nr:hypothetical protein HPP92_026015 [Vanilla planifolia]
MSMTDSDFSIAGDYKNFRQVTRDRLLYEMLQSAKAMGSKTRWKVLIMDKLTADYLKTDYLKLLKLYDQKLGIIELIIVRSQLELGPENVIYVQKHELMKDCGGTIVTMFLADMSGRPPFYKRAFVFFSSPVSIELNNLIRTDGTVLSCIGALSEINLEYFAIDSQGFTTDHERALEDLFGANAEISQRHIACIHSMAARITTVFASLREFPFVHYRASTSSLDVSTITTRCDLIPTKLAAAVWYFLMRYKATTPGFSQTETCDLLILDRSIDQIAPIIHEWTYEAMCYDLLNMVGNKYVKEVPTRMGSSSEKKEVLLEDNDPIWLELRHAHIADASERLHVKLTNFVARNKAAQIHHNSRDSGELSTSDLQKMVQALPQYTEQIDKLSLHVEIAGKINKVVRESGLRELGQLEQNLIFGDATTKDLINFLRTNLDVTLENKLRLLMLYAAINPEKFEGDKEKLTQLARLPPGDMKAVHNMMRYLTLSESKKPSGGLSLKFDACKKKLAARKDCSDEEETWLLSRFYPIITELLEKLLQR